MITVNRRKSESLSDSFSSVLGGGGLGLRGGGGGGAQFDPGSRALCHFGAKPPPLAKDPGYVPELIFKILNLNYFQQYILLLSL